jgi:hypothetical protein
MLHIKEPVRVTDDWMEENMLGGTMAILKATPKGFFDDTKLRARRKGTGSIWAEQ